MKLARLSLMLGLLLSACQSHLLTDLAARPGDRLFWDDFSNASGGWPQASDEVGTLGLSNGAYRIAIQPADYDLWAVSGHAYGAVQVEADANRLAGPEANRFGLICGYRDAQDFYFFIISSDGYYALGKVENDAASLLGQEMMAYSSAIGQGTSPNHLRLECHDQTLRGAVNGQMVAVAQDSRLGSGDVGMLAGSFEQGGVDIAFDNFVVTKP
jgi:hypothetical protein